MGAIVILIQKIIFGLINAIRTTTIQEEAFINGKVFSYEGRIEIPIGVTNIVFDPTAFTGVNLTINPLFFSATAGPILIDFYTGTDADDDGTLLLASNRREGSPGPESILRLNPSINSDGTLFSNDLIPASGAGVGNANGSSNQPGLPFEVNKSLKKMVRLTNEDGAGVYFQIKMTWLEL